LRFSDSIRLIFDWCHFSSTLNFFFTLFFPLRHASFFFRFSSFASPTFSISLIFRCALRLIYLTLSLFSSWYVIFLDISLPLIDFSFSVVISSFSFAISPFPFQLVPSSPSSSSRSSDTRLHAPRQAARYMSAAKQMHSAAEPAAARQQSANEALAPPVRYTQASVAPDVHVTSRYFAATMLLFVSTEGTPRYMKGRMEKHRLAILFIPHTASLRIHQWYQPSFSPHKCHAASSY